MKQVSLSRYLYLKIKRIIMAAIIEEFNEYRSRIELKKLQAVNSK
jgi:hypothetical protein